MWADMKQRCRNAKHRAYKWYGARGVGVCDRWLNFQNFYEDMGQRPSDSHSLDRIDPHGNYEPGNCRWATAAQQQQNRTNNLLDSTGAEWIRFWRHRGYGIKAIGVAFGVHKSTVSAVARGKRWL